MNKELIINVTPNEISIALFEDKQLVELNKEKCKTGFSVGDIYLGKVKKIMPGLNAAFVNIGHEKDAFIHYLDLGPQFTTMHKLVGSLVANKRVSDFENLKMEKLLPKSGKLSGSIASGQAILVQIAKEAISTKGPRLTADISLAGRNVVLIPFSNKVSISQKIRSNEERKRLKKIVSDCLPKNFGVILRTAAMGRPVEDIEQDIQSLVQRWHTVLDGVRTNPIPALILSEENRTTTILRDLLNGSFSNIYVDDPTVCEEVREYIRQIAPEKEKIVKLYKGNVSIFDNFDVSKQIMSLFSKYVSLKKGAYLIIEHTEALHVVDVNSGNRAKVDDDQEQTAMDVNLAAATELARQLRLRDMGGIIVVDFIDLHKSENRAALVEKMRSLMATDRAKHTILPLSKFGLMQITRQRVRPETHIDMRETCPACHGTGLVAPAVLLDDQIEKQIAYFVREKGAQWIKLRVNPVVAAFLTKGLWSLRLRWMVKYHCWLRVVKNTSTGMIETRFFNRHNEELV
ncbi:MAG: Rne/Rng family ribonuclease [Alistipes sp.]|nr:Rne/Rng family ribonuclease [Alistipes sp.]